MIKQEDVYKIGKLGKPHGVKGEISFIFNDDVFDRTDAEYLVIEIEGILIPFYMEEYRFHGNETALIKFCDIDTQEQAKELTGHDVYFPRAQADTDRSTVSWAQMHGLRLIDAIYNKPIGTIYRVDDSTPNILFEVNTADGHTALIPANERLIEEIDMDKREIRMKLPEGILDLE